MTFIQNCLIRNNVTIINFITETLSQLNKMISSINEDPQEYTNVNIETITEKKKVYACD